MSKKTNIQWCHSTVNPCMGCDGCELWSASPARLLAALKLDLNGAQVDCQAALNEFGRLIKRGRLSDIYQTRRTLADQVEARAPGTREAVDRAIRREAKCYAGLLGTNRAGHPGYADCFEAPRLFPGRMREAANWALPTLSEVTKKPWLAGLPRLIFISDMGDALSRGVEFTFLEQEIVSNVSSATGRRHIWLWLTKRPSRMAEFGHWLSQRGIAWPDNLVAMTTVTSDRTAARADALQDVPNRFKGLSLEPLFEAVDLRLDGIDWVIVGGGSDSFAQPFNVEWALELRDQCRAAGVAFFLKQLGRNPFFRRNPLPLDDGHGGNWTQWPAHWRTRQMPAGFSNAGQC